MMSYPLDIGYMGVHNIWTNNLGTCMLAATHSSLHTLYII